MGVDVGAGVRVVGVEMRTVGIEAGGDGGTVGVEAGTVGIEAGPDGRVMGAEAVVEARADVEVVTRKHKILIMTIIGRHVWKTRL